MPTAIGDTLREARMRQKIDIAEIEAKTKIRAKYLRAMENEEFELLPGTTFAKSFLRTYADALGLDSHRLVEEYRAQYEARDEAELPPLAGQGRGAPRERGYARPPSRAAALLALAVVAIVVLVVIGLASGGGSSKTSTTTTSATAHAGKRHQRRHHRAVVPTRVVLRVTPTAPTYICVDHGLGTTPVYQGITDLPQTFRGRHLRLNLGKTSVSITANGKRIALVPSPNPAGLDFTPRTHKEIPVGQRPCA